MMTSSDKLNDLIAAFGDLVNRCDGDDGVRADGSNIDTAWAHSVLDPLDADPDLYCAADRNADHKTIAAAIRPEAVEDPDFNPELDVE